MYKVYYSTIVIIYKCISVYIVNDIHIAIILLCDRYYDICYILTYIHVYIHICLCLYMYMCVCIYLYSVLHYTVVAITTYKRKGRKRERTNRRVRDVYIY